MNQIYCGQCGTHWKEGVAEPHSRQPSRRRTKSREHGKGRKGKVEKGGKMDPSPALPPPWVTTTPTKVLPAVPTPPAGLEEEGSSEQLKNLQRLRQQLQEAGAEVPPEIQATLKDLEASLMPAAPTISHKTVSQVQKWTNKVAKLHQQVEELDQGFDKAKAYLKTVYQEQKNTYLDLRKQAMEQLEEARQKLKDAQRAVQEASAQLSDPRSPPKEVMEEDMVLSASEDEELNKNSRKRASSQPLDKANLLFRGSRSGDPKVRKEGKTAEEVTQANGQSK